MSGYWNVNSNLISSSATLGSLSITNITVGNIFYTGSIIQNGTASSVLGSSNNFIATNLTSTNLLSTNITSTNNTLTNLILTSGSFGSLSSANISVSGNITVGGNLLVNGSLISVNVTSLNVINTNISAGTLNATNTTTVNLVSTNISTGTLELSNYLDAVFNSNTLGNIFTTGGNVGINTTSPSAKLHILETTATTGNPADFFIDKLGERSVMQVWGYANSRSNLLLGSNAYLSNAGNLIMRHTGGSASGWYMMMGSESDGFKISRATATNTTVDYFNMNSSGSTVLSVLSGVDKVNNIRIGRNDSPTIRYHDLEFQTSVTQASSYMGIKLHNATTTTSQTEVMRLRADGNVGIGTTAPSYTLDVNGTARIASGLITTFNSNTLGNLFTTAGNVGIGTVTPNAPLQLSNSLINRKIVLHELVNNDHQFNGFGINASIVRYQASDTSNSHVFYAGVNSTTSNEIFRISGLGNITVPGTTNSVSLSSGNAFFTNVTSTNITSTNIVASNITVASLVITTGTLLMNSNQNIPINFSTSYSGAFTNLAFIFAPNQTNGNNSCSTRIFHGQGVGASYNSGQIGFNYISSNNVNNFASFSVYGVSPTINVNGNGYVGINTTAPAYTLDINGSFRAQSNINGVPNSFYVGNSNSGSAAYGIIQIYNDTSNNLSMFLNSTSRSNDGGLSAATIRNDGGPLRLSALTSNASYLYLSTSGNVGINTSTPSYTLDIAGTSKISTRLDIGGIQPGLNGSTIGQLFITGPASSATGPHIMMNTTQDQFPTLYLHNWTHDINAVCFDSYFDGQWRTSSTTGGFALWKNSGQLQMRYAVGSAGSLIANGVHTAGLVMTTGGNIGINNTAPAFNLDVTGTSRITTGLTIGGYVLTGTGSANGLRVGTASRVYDDNEMHLQTTTSVMHLDVGGLNDTMYLTNNNIGINVSQLSLSNGTRNTILFNGVGVSAPINAADLGSGCKLKLWDNYGIGIENFHMWFCTGNDGFKWYNGTTARMQLTAANLVVTGDISGFGTISDQRLKTNINSISGVTALDTIKLLRPVTFNWREDIFNTERAGTSDSGFIAQEVEPIIPHAIGDYTDINSQTVYKNMRHERIIPYLTAAIQALFEKSEQKQQEYDTKLEEMQAEIDLLKSKLN
jgi:hypothetical protein